MSAAQARVPVDPMKAYKDAEPANASRKFRQMGNILYARAASQERSELRTAPAILHGWRTDALNLFVRSDSAAAAAPFDRSPLTKL